MSVTISWEHKGFPSSTHGHPAADLKDLGLQVPDDVSTPFASLRESVLLANRDAMAAWCRARSVELAPHVKTTMSPELMGMQLDGGAWGTTAATAWQARAQVELGSPRVLIANETIDGAGLRALLARARDRGAEVLVFADSPDGVAHLSAAVAAVEGAAPLAVIIDVGHPGGRAGVRDHADALVLADQVARDDHLLLAGAGGYEGVVGSARTAQILAGVRAYLQRIRAVGDAIADRVQRAEGGVLTAGGSLFYDLVAEEFAGSALQTVVRPGCYLVHDHGVYARNAAQPGDDSRPSLAPAMEIWARVISAPEPGRVLADAGRRDISSDAGMPVVLAVVRDGVRLGVHPEVAITGFNDQHTFLSVPSDDGEGTVPGIGDVLVLGISHPCTTIDKWRAIAVIDDDAHLTGAVSTYF